MTLIAGIFSRKPNEPLPACVCSKLRQAISRYSGDAVTVFDDQRIHIVRVDIGAFDENACREDENNSITWLTGEPLLNVGEERYGRRKDAARIHKALTCHDQSILNTANGVFSAVHYQPDTGTVQLITDKLGLRPLYFWVDDDYLIFASALRVLEALSEVPKRLDVRAVTEMVGLGFALGDRTPYVDIRLLCAAETVTISGDKVTYQKYWNWDEIEISTASEEELLSDLYVRFDDAIAKRIGNDTITAAYLSGGLDSRCIVAGLRDRDVCVHTFNFARPGTQDQTFGSQFAKEIGSVHKEVPKNAGDLTPDYSSLMAESWTALGNGNGLMSEHPALVWSGEGGSVALGHVHLNEEIVGLMRTKQIDEAVRLHIRNESAQVSPRLFHRDLSEVLSKTVEEGVRDELASLNCKDPARNFYFYLLLNDQHRKLAKHFENIDLHRLEFQLPFFDSSFLALVASMPIDICLRHRFYVKWLSFFPQPVTNVPWQVYPGHEPCPVSVENGLDYQWANKYKSAELAARRSHVLKQASELLRSANFPEPILNRRNLRIASWIQAMGFRDYEYIIGPAHTYYSYWQKCDGKYVL